MKHSNLTTCPLPGVHNHTNIADALQKLADEWLIDFESQVSCLTTDNGSNIVKALKDDLKKMHIPCAGHDPEQQLLKLPKHSLIQNVSTRWNSTHDMIKKACEQQPRDLTHLELSSSEWRLLEDVAEVPEPYKDVTTYLSSDSYPTISALGPLYAAVRAKLIPSDDSSDSGCSAAVKRCKQLLAIDMSARYQYPTVLPCV